METTIIKTWETSNGIKVEVKGEIVLEKIVNLDGQKDSVPACDIKVSIFTNGSSQGSWIQELNDAQKKQVPASYTHYVGNLPLKPEHVESIRSVKEELEQHPAWIAKQEAIAKNQAEIAEYETALTDVKGGYRDENTY